MHPEPEARKKLVPRLRDEAKRNPLNEGCLYTMRGAPEGREKEAMMFAVAK